MGVWETDIGMQGHGKSLRMARNIRKIYARNLKWAKKSGIVRQISANQPLNITSDYDKAFFDVGWNDVKELSKKRGMDIFWDEIANDLDARNFALLSNETKRLLSRADKRGLEIYCNTQDFDMIDKRARRMMTAVNEVTKWFGSPRPAETKPPVLKPWGFYWVREFQNFRDETAIMNPQERNYSLVPVDFFWLEPADFELYDTLYETGNKQMPPLEHIDQICERYPQSCSFHKAIHI